MIRKAGTICVVLGICLILASVGLYAYFETENKTAEKNTDNVIAQIISYEQVDDTAYEVEEDIEADTIVVKTIDGNDYVGYLSIPALSLKLPIMSECNYDKLKLSPCRYHGWAGTRNMVIAGHNYRCHFSKLSQLKHGDEVIFTDMRGVVYKYQVADIEILPPSARQEMIESDWDLTLYTCNYSATSRITIRCSEVE